MCQSGVFERRPCEAEFLEILQSSKRRQICIRDLLAGEIQIHNRRGSLQEGEQRGVGLFHAPEVDVIPVQAGRERLHQHAALRQLREGFLLGLLNFRTGINIRSTAGESTCEKRRGEHEGEKASHFHREVSNVYLPQLQGQLSFAL